MKSCPSHPRLPRLAAVLAVALLGATAVGATTPLSLHLLHPLAVPSDPDNECLIRASLMYGRSGSVRALDVGLVAGVTAGDMQGLQLQGVYAGVGGDLRGIGATAGLNLVQGDVAGVQFGGIGTWTGQRVTGLQWSAFLNYAGGGVGGAQVTSFLNISDGPVRYLQASGVANVAADDVAGWQLASLINHANATLTGLQTGILNVADEGRGVQLGVINMAREMRGVQIGAVNVAREFHGVPVGMINHADGNPRHWLLYGSTLSLINLGYRTEVNGWVSTVSGGYGDAHGSQEKAGFLAWHFGHRLLGGERHWLSVDLGLVHVMPVASDDPDVNDRLHPAVQLRLTGDLALGKRWGLWGAVGVSSIAAEYDDEDDAESELLLAGGVVLR